MQIKDLNELAKKLSEKLNKSKINIIYDILKCKNKYKTSLEEYDFYEFYSLTDKERSTFLTKEKNNELIKLYNNDNDKILLEDRGLLYKEFSKYINREYIDLREVTFKEFVGFISNRERITCRVINGNDYEILEIDKDKLKNEYNILKIYNSIMKKEEFIIEDVINQNKSLSKLYSKSLNTVRITTILDEEVNIINKVLIIGNKGSNIKDGALYAFLDDKGTVNIAQDIKGHSFREHPVTFERLSGFTVPYFKEIVNLTKELANFINTLKYVTWEFAVLDEGISLIDASIPYEILQCKPSINNCKEGLLKKIESKGEIYER